MKIQITKLNDNAKVPSWGSENAAGADLYACLDTFVQIGPNKTEFIKTGISMAIPEGYAGFIFARSGLACKHGLAPANKVGVIDADYRGEIIVALHNHSNTVMTVVPGDRVAQMTFEKVEQPTFEVVDKLPDTVRGDGGFGSTGSN